jgi:protein phosphatase 1G
MSKKTALLKYFEF